MKTANKPRSRGQVYSVGNYLMTGKVLGKGHFARVEEATHRIIGKKVAIKVIDLTCIKEEYARRNLHREPRVMAKLRHPCIAALYETMMHGPRLYVVMEEAGGGDLCALVLAARGAGGVRGLPEARARALAAQLVSAVRHMHARGVVHRDLKMENIMLDSTKQFIKIVDFGLSNVWSAGGALRTPCGSLEYAAPELFVDGRRYGPEVDLWSIGVIVYGMVTGGLPFSGEGGGGAGGAEARSRPHLRAAIARGFTRKQRAALAATTSECRTFVQQLLEPAVELRMRIEEAARHRWVRRPAMRMRTHPLASIEPKHNRELYKQISELCGQTMMDVEAQIKADPFGPIAGMYNIKTHLHQLQAVPGVDLLWSSAAQEPRPVSPPEYRTMYDTGRPEPPPDRKTPTPPLNDVQQKTQHQKTFINSSLSRTRHDMASVKTQINGSTQMPKISTPNRQNAFSQVSKDLLSINAPPKTPAVLKLQQPSKQIREVVRSRSQPIESPRLINRSLTNNGLRKPVESPGFLINRSLSNNGLMNPTESPRLSTINKSFSNNGLIKPIYKIYDNGDCRLDPRLPSIDEHSNLELNGVKRYVKAKPKTSCVRRVILEDERRLSSCPNRMGDGKRTDLYRRAGDSSITNWRSNGTLATPPPPRILFQSNATTIKRASLGNIVSPHSSSNSHCKSERGMPVGWYSTRSQLPKEGTHLQRLRRTAPIK